MTRSRLLGPIGARLALAFVAVALVAVAVLAGLTAFGTRQQVDDLVRRQHAAEAAAVAAAGGQAYDAAQGWASADLSDAIVLARAGGATLEIRDQDGQVVSLGSHGGPLSGSESAVPGGAGDSAAGLDAAVTADVRSHDVLVGTVALRYPVGHLPAPERAVRAALLADVLAGAGLAALVALVVAVVVSRRITRPLVALTAATQELASGSPRSRVDLPRAPGEIGALARAFDRMVDSLDRQDELRRAVVADVAHELRTPLTILQGACEALQDGVEAPTPERLASLHDEVLRLARLVGDLEALSAAEAAGLDLELREVELAEIVDDAVRSLADHAADAGLDLVTDLQPVIVNGDRARLRQVAVNLVINAIKFTPRGGTVTITVAPQDRLARLEVRDTGPGIPQDEISRVFDRFWRGRGSAGTSGSGIGLAVVAQLVRAHRAQVHAANGPAGGARFTVFLPRD